jgi:hypothetical protein
MKIARRTGIIIFILIIILAISGGIFISTAYEETAIKYLKKYLDYHLITEIEVDNINFSLLKSFPYASVRFKNVYSKSSLNFSASDFPCQDTDTLLTAASIFFEFGLLKLLAGKYEIRNININNGKIKILIDRDGRPNYSIWDPGEKKSSSGFNMNLQSLVLSDIDLYIINLKDKYSVTAYDKKLSLKGNLSDSLNSLIIKGNFHITDFTSNNKHLLGDKELHFESDLLNKKNNYAIRKSKVKLGSMNFNVSGDILYDQSIGINLHISSGRAKLPEILSLFQNKSGSSSGIFSVSGNSFFDASISGNLSGNSFPHIVTSFTITNGTLLNKSSGEKLSGISLRGSFTNGEQNNSNTSSVTIEEFFASAHNSKINGRFIITNFELPNVKLDLNADIDLNEMHHLFDFDTLEYVNGKLNAKIEIAGRISDLTKISKTDFIGFTKNCILNFSGTNFKIAGTGFIFDNINGEVLINNNIQFTNLYLGIGDNNFLVNGILYNLFEFVLFKNKNLALNADISSDNFDVKSLLANHLHDETKNNNPEIPSSENVFVNTNVSFKKLKYDKFYASDISGVINYSPGIINFRIMQLNSLDGTMTGHGSIIERDEDYFIQCQSDLKLIDINRFFYVFNNFGQNFIVDKNLKGNLSGDVIFSATMDKKTGFKMESIKADGNLKIENGELIQFEPMMGLSKYISLEELSHIKFKTLNNEILIKDQIITIPEMDIYSSAINITALGIHKFDNSYDYRIKVSMTDLLFNKARKKRKEIENFGIIEDDELGKISIPLRFTGKGDKYEITFDKKTALSTLKKNIQNEKKVIGNIFQEEFNYSRKDTADKENYINKKGMDYNISWEEQYDKKDVLFENQDINKSHSPDYIIDWDENEDTSDRKNY